MPPKSRARKRPSTKPEGHWTIPTNAIRRPNSEFYVSREEGKKLEERGLPVTENPIRRYGREPDYIVPTGGRTGLLKGVATFSLGPFGSPIQERTLAKRAIATSFITGVHDTTLSQFIHKRANKYLKANPETNFVSVGKGALWRPILVRAIEPGTAEEKKAEKFHAKHWVVGTRPLRGDIILHRSDISKNTRLYW